MFGGFSSPLPTLGLPSIVGPPGVPFTSTPLPQLQLKGGEAGTVIDGSPLIASPAVPRWTPRVMFSDAKAGPVGAEGAELGRQASGGVVGGLAPAPPAGTALAIAPLALPVPVPPHLLLGPTFLPPGMLSNLQPLGPAYLPSAPPSTSTVPCEVPVMAVPAAVPSGPLVPLVPSEPSLSEPDSAGHISSSPATIPDDPAAAEAPNSAERSRRRLFSGGVASSAAALAAASRRPAAVAAPEGTEPRGSRPSSGAAKRQARGGSVESTQRKRDAAALEEEAAEDGCGEGTAGEHLTLEFLEENGYFDMPIQQAASALNVGVTTLKKICRVNAIGRWPFRKRSSLDRLIEKTREYFASDPEQCAEAVAQLEAQRSVLRAQQGEDIPDAVKRYRQSIFKLDYKVKKFVKERRTHRGAAAAALAPTDKAHTIKQLGVGTPANHLLGLLCTDGDARHAASKEPSPKEEPQQ